MNAPVVVERSTPDTEVEYLHEDQREGDITSQGLYGDVLCTSDGKARIHEQQAALDTPSAKA